MSDLLLRQTRAISVFGANLSFHVYCSKIFLDTKITSYENNVSMITNNCSCPKNTLRLMNSSISKHLLTILGYFAKVPS